VRYIATQAIQVRDGGFTQRIVRRGQPVPSGVAQATIQGFLDCGMIRAGGAPAPAEPGLGVTQETLSEPEPASEPEPVAAEPVPVAAPKRPYNRHR